MLRHFDPTAVQFDDLLTRNAALAVRLRKTIAALHLAAPDHPRSASWRTCSHDDCRKALDLTEGASLDGRA